MKQNGQNKMVLNRLIDDVWSKGNLSAVDELVAPASTLGKYPGDPWEGKTLDHKSYNQSHSVPMTRVIKVKGAPTRK